MISHLEVKVERRKEEKSLEKYLDLLCFLADSFGLVCGAYFPVEVKTGKVVFPGMMGKRKAVGKLKHLAGTINSQFLEVGEDECFDIPAHPRGWGTRQIIAI